MKKPILTVLALSAALFAMGQHVEVASLEKVNLQSPVMCEMATVSPDGSFAIVGLTGGNVLTRVDLATGATTTVTNNGNPRGLAISADGQNVVFRSTLFNKNGLKMQSLNSVNLATGAEKQLVKPSRRLNAGMTANASGVTAVENGRTRVSAFGSAKAASLPVASINYGHLDITVNGKTTTLDPQGRGSYLWPSISPDGTKVVYGLAGAGCFVCNIDGTDARQLGNIHAPAWLGNDLIVAMADHTSSQAYIDSKIVVSDLNGKMQTLTPASMIAIYPSASADGKTVTFCDVEGNLYRITLK